MAEDRMPTDGGPNHWERWRGDVNARLRELAETSRRHDQTCRDCKGNIDHHFGDLYRQLHSEVAGLNEKVAKIETRIAWIAGIAALAGSGATTILTQVFQKLGGG